MMRSGSCGRRQKPPIECATEREGGWPVTRTDRPIGWPLARTAVIVACVLTMVLAGTTLLAAAAEGEPIPMTTLTGLSSLAASVQLDVDGTIDGKPTTGDLHAELTTTDQGTSKIEVT